MGRGPSPVRSAVVNVMMRAVDRASGPLRRDFGEVENLQVSRKGPANFVSIADTRAERTIREVLQKGRPDYGLLMEESGETKGADETHRWIVDPLDGTTNFVHGIPHFAISIALERESEIVAGVIHNPVTDETFWAEKGKGAFQNDRRIRVSGRRMLDDSVIATGVPHIGRGDHGRFRRQLGVVMANVAGIRRMGAAALDLAYVAAGRFDGFWEEDLSPWDLAAGVLIVREAGGFVSDTSGRADVLKSGSVIAANQNLHAPLARLLAEAQRES